MNGYVGFEMGNRWNYFTNDWSYAVHFARNRAVQRASLGVVLLCWIDGEIEKVNDRVYRSKNRGKIISVLCYVERKLWDKRVKIKYSQS